MSTCGAIWITRTQVAQWRAHIRLDLSLRERAIVNADIVDPTSEVKPGGSRSLADVDIGGRNLLRRCHRALTGLPSSSCPLR